MMCATICLFVISISSFAQSNQTVTSGSTTAPVTFPGPDCAYTWTNSDPSIGLPSSGTGNIPAFTAKNTGVNSVIATITATPAAANGFAYITDGNNNVSVIDISTDKVVATIPVGATPLGVAISADGTRVYITNQGGGGTPSISVINASTNKVIATIAMPPNSEPSWIMISPDGKTIYVGDYNIGSVSVINTATNTITGTITVGTFPWGMAISPDGSTLYVANGNSYAISVINTSSNTVTATIPLTSAPTGIALSPDGTRLYVGLYNTNTISVISTSNYAVIGTATVGMNPVSITVAPDGSRVYISNGYSNTVSVVDATNNATIATIPMGFNVNMIDISRDGSKVYALLTNNQVAVIDTKTNSVIATIPVGSGPESLGKFVGGCPAVTFKITVNSDPDATNPTITTTSASGNISACVGTASVSPNIQQFTVSGSNLTGIITATAPPGFQISFSANGTYGNSVSLAEAAGVTFNTPLYIRSAPTDPAGNISGNVVLSSPGATNQTVAVSGVVHAIPTVNTVANQTVNAGSPTTAINFTGTGNTYSWTNNTPSIGLAASGSGNIPAFTTVNAGASPVTAAITVTPQSISRAYVVNNGSNSISVINTVDNTVISSISVGASPFGVGVSPDGTRVYVTNSADETVSVINAQTNSVIATIKVGNNPLGAVVSPDGRKIYIANGEANNGSVSVIDASTNLVIANIPVGSAPEGITISPDGSTVYTSNILSNSVSAISTATNTVIATISTGLNPAGIAVSADGSKLYVANGGGTVSVINAITNTIITTITAGANPQGIAISPDGGTIYVTNFLANTVSVINAATNTIEATINTQTYPQGISVSPDDKDVYVANHNSGTVSVIDVATNTVINNINVGATPISMGKFISSGSGCSGIPATFTITVNPVPVQPGITAGSATGFILACAGAPSVSPHIQQIQVSGASLTGNITATAPTGFEISTAANGSYSSSLVLQQSGGTLKSTIVYVRSTSSAPIGHITGNITFSSPGVNDQTVAVSELINPIITVDPVPNQTVKAGAPTAAINFTGTASGYTWSNNTPGIGLPASGTGNIAAFTAVNTGTTPITATITATPVQAAYAYVPNYVRNVNVINVLTGDLLGTISAGNSPESVAISQDGRHVYICNSNSDDISVVDGTTNTVTTLIPTGFGSQPYYIALSPDGNTLYAACSAFGTVLVISTATNKVISTINVGINPVCITPSPDGQKLYVTNLNSETISVISTSNYVVTKTISLGVTAYATTISPDGSRLYVAVYGSSSEVLVIDTSTGNVIASIPVAMSAQSIVITPDGSKVYVTDSNANAVTVISTATNSIITTINVDNGPFGIAVSPDGSLVCVTNGYGNDVSVISTATDKVIRTVHAASALGLGNFVTGSTGCTGPSVTFTITVNPIGPPSFTATADLQGLTTTYGTPSSSESFTITGANLTGGVLVTPPPGFEVSTDGTNFSPAVTVGSAGDIAAAKVYIRLAATTPVGTYSGNIVLTSPGAPNVNVVMPASAVTKAMLIITADNQTKPLGTPNPELTVSYKGFVNGDTQGQLTTLPVATTIATTSSAPGQYVITVDGAKSPNYNFTYVNGTLTILPSLQSAVIPNAFTPNGDGVNDFWNIPELADFPTCIVSIYTRYGSLVFQSRGYGKPWDGTSNGSPVPMGTYYYIIDPRQDNIKPLSGYVAVIR
jgi:gliding motility-associated-like protein